MATHKGGEGTIKVSSNAVAELLSYSITENVDLIETTNITDAARLYTTGKTSWGGEISTKRGRHRPECLDHWCERDAKRLP